MEVKPGSKRIFMEVKPGSKFTSMEEKNQIALKTKNSSMEENRVSMKN